jgi:hypothetical protein
VESQGGLEISGGRTTDHHAEKLERNIKGIICTESFLFISLSTQAMTHSPLLPLFFYLSSSTLARRQVDELLVQEGFDIGNKKDESKAASILEMCSKRKIPITSMPKHDLNLLVDNRPHQGFVLRTQPLEIAPIASLPAAEDSFKSPPPPPWFHLSLTRDLLYLPLQVCLGLG